MVELTEDEIRQHVVEATKPYISRLNVNIARLGRLLQLAKDLGESHEVHDDLIRSAVVFLHATVEDLLRTVAEIRLPLRPPGCLEQIPWLNTDGALKASLSTLANHRGRSVDDVIKECVHAHLARRSFNNTKDVVALLKQCGISKSGKAWDAMLKALSEITARRHQIVHRADLDPSTGKPVAPISYNQAIAWTVGVIAFVMAVVEEVAAKEAVVTLKAKYSELAEMKIKALESS